MTHIVTIPRVSSDLSVCLSVCVSACPSVYLPVCLSVCLTICVSVCVCLGVFVCLSGCLPEHLSVCLSLCLPVHLSVCPSVCPSVGKYPQTQPSTTPLLNSHAPCLGNWPTSSFNLIPSNNTNLFLILADLFVLCGDGTTSLKFCSVCVALRRLPIWITHVWMRWDATETTWLFGVSESTHSAFPSCLAKQQVGPALSEHG